jgi:hypothetical protein
MPLLLLGALAALPWVATLGLRMNILFDPPAQGATVPLRHPQDRTLLFASVVFLLSSSIR